ncbi:MAG TPA: helix-turn-helix transcriptional regulator [Coleofasciculaceae cyanobacterium]
MDEVVLKRLSEAVLLARGDRSQREFSRALGVAQSTIQAWENGRNTPSLENLEKLARIRGDLPESFLAYLYGRSVGEALPIEQQIEVMSCQQISKVMKQVADRLGRE